jgi:hypothetical protein
MEEYMRWKHNMMMDLKEIGSWGELAQDRDHWRALVNTALNLQVT